MLWGYHTIFPPHKYTQDEADSPPHPSNADNKDAADDNVDDNDADNDADDNADVDADNNNTMLTADDNTDLAQCR
jgi:hypothetical protein